MKRTYTHTKISSLFLCMCVLATGCSSNQTATESEQHISAEDHNLVFSTNKLAAADPLLALTQQKNTLVVYMPKNALQLQTVVKSFALEKGIDVSVFEVGNTDAQLLEIVKKEGKKSPVDLLILSSKQALDTAKATDILQAVHSKDLQKVLPESLRFENYWFALASNINVLVSKSGSSVKVSNYKDLLAPRFKGSLCLKSSQDYSTQSLVTSLTNNLEPKAAEKTVATLKKNLALKPMSDDAQILKAIQSGTCKLGLVNESAYFTFTNTNHETLAEKKPSLVKQSFAKLASNQVNVVGAGITKYSPNPLKTLMLVEWLTSQHSQIVLNAESNTQPVIREILSASALQTLKNRTQAQTTQAQEKSKDKKKTKKKIKKKKKATPQPQTSNSLATADMTNLTEEQITAQLLKQYGIEDVASLTAEQLTTFKKEERFIIAQQKIKKQPLKHTVAYMPIVSLQKLTTTQKLLKKLTFDE